VITPRERLVRAAGILLATGFIADLLAQPIRTFRFAPMDFGAFSGAARMLAQGQGHLIYSPVAQNLALSAYAGVPIPAGNLPFLNPPLAAALLVPLVQLPFRDALGLFTLASLLCVAVSAWLLLRWVLPGPLVSARGLVVITGTASVASGWNLVMSNWDALLLLALAGAVVAQERRRPLLAGILLSALLLKPQVLWLVPVALLVARQWRVLLGLLLGAGLWAISSLLLVGPAAMAQWVQLDLSASAAQASMGTGIPGLFAVWSTSAAASALVVALGLAVTALVMWRLRAASRRTPSVAMALGVSVSLLFAPHILAPDLCLLGVPVALLARTSPRAALAGSLLISATLWPYASAVGFPAEVHIALLPQLLVAGGLVRDLHSLGQGERPPDLPATREMLPSPTGRDGFAPGVPAHAG
jgi:hypothetical protein